MKLLLLAALVATGSCSWWYTNEETVPISSLNTKYTSGNEYVYKYESQVLTGVPVLSKQYGGIKIVSKAKIAFTSSSDAVLQLDEVRVLSMNHEIHNPDQLLPTQQISVDQFSPLPSDQSRLLVERLQQPIKFRYQAGKVERIEISNEESKWSVDLKRSILSMLQIRLQANDFTITENLEYNNLEKENYTTFDWLEQGLDGECYSMVHVSQSLQDTKHFKVVKARDSSRCLTLNQLRKDVQPHQQRNCQCEDNFNKKNCVCKPDELERKSQEQTEIRTNYDLISDDRAKFLIHKAVQTVEYRYQSPHVPTEYALTTSNQTLIFLEEKPQPTVSVSGITFTTINEPWKWDVVDNEKLMMTEQQLLDTIREILSEMETISTNPERYEDHASVFYQLISHLRLCNKRQLETLFSEAKNNDNTSQNKKWKVLIDGMSFVNTTVCDKFLLQKIVENEIQNLEASSIFAVWTSDKIPTPTILDFMLSNTLPTLQSQTGRKITYKHAMLCFGSMVRRYINQEQRSKYESVKKTDQDIHQSNIDNCRKYEKYVESRLTSASTEEDKILCLKTVANMGNIKALPAIQRLLKRSEPKAVRVQAIWAFNKFGQQNQIQTLQSLLPLMNHHQECTEIRTAAFTMVMKCDPSSSLLEIQKQLNYEPDREYKTFVVKYLQNYLQRREPGHEYSHSKIRVILKNIRAFQLSEQTTDIEIPFSVSGDELNADIVRYSFLSNQTSRFSRGAAFQQLSMTNGVRRHIVEVGYRTEGLEKMIEKLTEKTSAISSAHSDLSVLNRLSSQTNKPQPKPSITFYAKLMGQEITFWHFDETAINNLIMQGLRTNTDGYVVFPIKFFQTIYFKPYQMRKLMPNGMWQLDETLYSGVFDVDGNLKIKMVQGEMPSISFETLKPIRKEFKTLSSQYVDAGFSISGVSSAMVVRRATNSANMTITYFPEENKIVYNHTHPTQQNDLFYHELRSYTSSFVMPLRLPHVVKQKDVCFKQLKMEEPERKHFTHEFEAFKSVELEAKVECDVNMPDLYSFIRERFHLLPTLLSVHPQLIKLSFRPQTSAQRNFTLTLGGRYFDQAELELMEGWRNSSDEESLSVKYQQPTKSFFHYLWSSKDAEEVKYEKVSAKKFLKSESLGSLYYFQYMHLTSESYNNVLNMTGNLTRYYEHDFPITKSLLRFERPPVPSLYEREPVEYVNRIISTVNPGNNEFIWAHNMTWGERTQSEKPALVWTMKFVPDYKDGVCYSETVQGCKNEFGVVNPIWINATHMFNYNNTDVVERYLNWTRPYLTRSAESILTYPMNWTPLKDPMHGRFNVSQIIRPHNNKMDVALPLSLYHPICVQMNTTNIYSPLEVKFWQWMIKNQYPVSQIRRINDYLPIHNRINPFEARRDRCVIQAPKSYTFDRKEITMPKTDCEVVLAGNCRASNKELLITVKPATNQDNSVERVLKAVIGSNKIEIVMKPKTSFTSQQMKVKVNGIERSLNDDDQVVVEESGEQVALVQCDELRCEILSEKYGVYTSIDSEQVKVEVNTEKSQEMCGLCAFTPERFDELTMTDSLNMFNENKVPNQQCSVEEPSKQEQYQQCTQIYKHKVKYWPDEFGRVLTCVSVDRMPVCSSKCDSKAIRINKEQFRCVPHPQAQHLEIYPRIEGEEMVLDDERILMKMKSARHINTHVNSVLTCRN